MTLRLGGTGGDAIRRVCAGTYPDSVIAQAAGDAERVEERRLRRSGRSPLHTGENPPTFKAEAVTTRLRLPRRHSSERPAASRVRAEHIGPGKTTPAYPRFHRMDRQVPYVAGAAARSTLRQMSPMARMALPCHLIKSALALRVMAAQTTLTNRDFVADSPGPAPFLAPRCPFVTLSN